MCDYVGSVSVSQMMLLLQQRASEDGATYGQARLVLARILEQQHFDSLTALIAFCMDWNNLRPWVANEAERVLCADLLVETLRRFETPPAP